MAATGEPVVVTAKAPAVLSVKEALDPLVMAGALAAATVMVRASWAVLPETLVAEMVTGKVPTPAVVVPLMVAVPLEPAVKVKPAGRAPDSVMVAAG